MADTWTPVFDLSTPEKVAVFTKTTETAIADIIAGVQRRARSRHMSPRLPAVLAQWFAQPCYHAARRTAHFRVEDSCIGCGLCGAGHPHGKRPAGVGAGTVRALPRLPAPLPALRHPVREAHKAARTVHESERAPVNE